MTVLVIAEHDVRRLLPMDECIEAMESVLRSLARGELHQPLRFVTRPPESDTLMGFMPAHRSGDGSTWSLKEIVIAPGNPARGLDTHQGAVILHDGETGELQAMLNASPITEIRTAAVSAVATRALARPGSRTVAILGAGVQARSHTEAMRTVLGDVEIRQWSRGDGGTARVGARRRGHRVHVHERARADPPPRMAGAGHSRERSRLERADRARARHRDDGRSQPLRRPPRVDGERVRATCCSPGSARTTFAPRSARC